MIRFDSLPPEVVQAMCTPMHLVLESSFLPGTTVTSGALYLGSLSAVNDIDLLREHRITHLVQVLDVPWLPQSEKNGFTCYRIDILDHSSVDLRPHLEAVCNHIDKALKSGQSVLVHCQQVRSQPHLSSSSRVLILNAIGRIAQRGRRHCIPDQEQRHVVR